MISLDGVMQAPGGPEEDPTGGFEYGGWVFPHWDEVGGQVMAESFAKPFDLLLGRKTYEIFAAHWPYQEGEIADPFNAATKYVATSSVEPSAWRNSVRLEGEVPGAVARLKEGDGPDLLTQGSAMLVRSLLAAGLVDELFLLVFPVLLGRGKRWFGEDSKPASGRCRQPHLDDRRDHGPLPAEGPGPHRLVRRTRSRARPNWRGARRWRRERHDHRDRQRRVSRHIAASPGRGVRRLARSGKRSAMAVRTPDGVIERCEIDARVGGRFAIFERRGADLAEHHGEYVEIDRPRRLAFDFWTSFSEERTRVTVTIAPDGDGARLALTHEGVWADYEERTQQGWTTILDGLAKAVE